MTNISWNKERYELLKACNHLVEAGLVTGSSGNVSMKLNTTRKSLVLITPQGLNLAKLDPGNLCLIDLEGEPIEEVIPPSSETAIHLSIYKARPDINSVIHSHPVYSSVISVYGKELPPLLDEMVLKIGGSVHISEYAFPGTDQLATNVIQALGNRMAVILRNHGLLTVGESLENALDNSLLTERLAQIFLYTSLLNRVNPLPKEIIDIEKELYQMRKLSRENQGGC